MTDAFDMRRDGDTWTFSWLAQKIAVGVEAVREASDGVHAEITARSGSGLTGPGPFHWGRLNLASTTQREALVRKLERAHPDFPWPIALERICLRVTEQYRAGAPIVRLQPAMATDARYLIERILPLGETTVFFGDGGSGKSLLALALGIAVSSNVSLPCGLTPLRKTRVLLADWESVREEHEERLGALSAGLNVAGERVEVFYRPMVRALADEAPLLRAEISRQQIGLVIVDSFGPACGAEPEGADAAIRTMNALRSFAPATRLIVAHVSKLSAEQRTGASRPFGSVYVSNLARSMWEIRRSEDEDSELVMGLFHRKANRGRLSHPIGLRFEFTPGRIQIRAQDVADRADLLNRTSLSYRVQKILAEGSHTSSEIAELAEAAEETVARTLRRLKAQGKVLNLSEAGAAKGGKGHEARWGLAR